MKKRILVTALLVALICAACTPEETIDPPKQYQEKLQLGKRYISESKYQEAVIAFHEVLQIDPRQEDAYVALADAYAAQGDTQKALETLQQGAEMASQTARLETRLELQQLEKRAEQAQAALSALNAELESPESRQEYDATIELFQKRHREHMETRDRNRAEYENTVSGLINTIQKQESAYEEEINRQQEEREKAEKEYETAEDERKELHQKHEEASAGIKTEDDAYLAQIGVIEEYRGTVQESAEKQAALEKELNTLESETDELRKAREETLAHLKEEQQKAEEGMEETNSQIAELTEKIKELEAEIQQKETEAREIQGRHEEISKNLSETQEKLDAAITDLNQKIKEQHETFEKWNSTQTVLTEELAEKISGTETELAKLKEQYEELRVKVENANSGKLKELEEKIAALEKTLKAKQEELSNLQGGPLLRELAALLEAEDYQAAFKIAYSEEFKEISSNTSRKNPKILYLNSEKTYGIGVYGSFIYLGGYQDGKREGRGIWLRYFVVNQRDSTVDRVTTVAIANWANDFPEGQAEWKEWFFIFKNGVQIRRCEYKHLGNVIHGLWDGEVSFNFNRYDDDGESFEIEGIVSVSNGKLSRYEAVEGRENDYHIVWGTERNWEPNGTLVYERTGWFYTAFSGPKRSVLDELFGFDGFGTRRLGG